MSSAGIKNWHWRTKGVESWAKEWFTTHLVGTEANGVTIDAVTDVEGDAEVGMRKSKLVTIYDQKVTMTWVAGDAKGSLVAIEVSHDMDEDGYEFVSSLTSGSGDEADAARLVAKKALADKLRPKFQQFPKDMLATHGKDLLAAEEADAASASASASSTPATKPSTPTASAPSPSTSTPNSTSTKLNTSSVKVDDTFQCTAADLFAFLTDPAKIPLWSRNPATMAPTVGAPMSLFGGNIQGQVTKVDAPGLLETTWRAPTWPEGHFGTLETTLVQGESSTRMTLRMSGVPVGKEEETEANLQRFYTSALKQIGFVSFSGSQTGAGVAKGTGKAGERRGQPQRRKKQPPPTSVWTYVGNGAAFLGSVGLLVALGAGIYYGPTGSGGKVASA